MLCSTMPTHLGKPGTPVNKWTGGWTGFEYKRRCFKPPAIRKGRSVVRAPSLPAFGALLWFQGKSFLYVFQYWDLNRGFRLALCQVPLVKFLLSYRFVRSGQWFKSNSEEAALLTQAQALTFLVRDQRLGANVGSAQGPTGLGKYWMPSRLERSFWGEKVCGFQTKKVGRRFQIVLFLYRKKDKTGFDFRKESEISLTGLSFWFQWA